MKFSALRDNINQHETQSVTVAEYQWQYLSQDHRSNIYAIKDRCVYHLFEDIANLKTTQDFEVYLGSNFYRTSNEYAIDCVELAYFSKHIFGKKIKHWTDSALKCFDIFLIRYINVVLQERIQKPTGSIKERDIYTHLINKNKDSAEYEVGIAFESIYQERNAFTHVQIEEADGIRKPVSWSTKKYAQKKEFILNQFEKGLRGLEVILSREPIRAEA